MLKRILTGAVIVVVTVGFFFLRGVDVRFFGGFIALIALAGTFEMLRAFSPRLTVTQSATVFCGAAVTHAALVFLGLNAALVAIFVTVCVLISLCVIRRATVSAEKLAFSLLCFIYPSVALVPLSLSNSADTASLFALVLSFAVSPLSDTFAFLVGVTLKGPKLCPSVSPKKTVSGAIGGLIGGICGGIIAYAFFKDTFVYHLGLDPYVYFGIVGLVAGALTEIGDLAESALKRDAGIKDMGKIFPGHGGMLDRVDGLIFASAFIYLVIALF